MNKGIAISELEILGDNEVFRPITKNDCPNVGVNIPKSIFPFQVFQIIENSCHIKCPLTQTLSCCGNKYPIDCQKDSYLLEDERVCNLEKQTLRFMNKIFNSVDIVGTRKP